MQRDLGWKLLADVAYVGSKGRKLLQTRNINAVPYGTNFLPSSIDPTTGGPLPANFLRPYRGYGDILLASSPASRTTTRCRRRSTAATRAALRFGASYTLSKAKNVGGTTGNHNPTVNPFLDIRARNYADVGRRHNLTINYSYEVPGLSKNWDTASSRGIFDNWQISGVTSALSGATLPIRLLDLRRQRSDRRRRRGRRHPRRHHLRPEPVAGRPIADPRVHDRVHRAAVAGQTNRVGTAVGDEIIGPGYLNWDITFAQVRPVRWRPGGCTFRCELYNAFNNVQFSTVNTGAIFNAAGQQTNGSSGSTPRRGRRGASCSRCALCSRRGGPCSDQEKELRRTELLS